MPRKQQHDVLFDKELRNKYHIRKFSAGIASVLFGTLVYTSLDQQAQAAENTDTAVVNPTTQPETNGDTATAELTKTQTNETVPTSTNETVNDSPTPQDTTIQQPSVDNQTSETATKPEPVTAPEVSQPTKTDTTQTDAPKVDTQKATEPSTDAPKEAATTEVKATTVTPSEPAVQPADAEVATRAAATTDTTTTEAPAQPITNTSAPAPAANAHPVEKIQGINEQVYAKEIPVYEKSEAARTARMQRGIYQARESLGLIVPQNKKLYIRQAQGSNEEDLRVDLMTNDRQTVRNATVSRDGSWTQISTTMDSGAFVRIPTGLTKKPVVEYYVEGDAGVTLPTYRKGGDKAAFDADWAARNTSYGYVDGDKIAFLVPNVDRERIANLGKNPGQWGFMNLDDMIGYYEDVINHYDKWVGLNDDINSVHYNVGQKYFTIADAHGPGLAYYSTNNMGSNNPSMSGYLERGWLALHEVGHGYDGAMTYDPKMNLIEIENNILANQYQTTIMGVKDGWAYEGRQESMQKDFHERVMDGRMNFYNAGFRGSLDFMTKMVRLTGIEGFADMWKGIRQEEADMGKAGKPFEQDVPRWITTYWLADNGINGTAYFDLYKVKMPQALKDDLDTYNNTFTYPLAALITNPEEQQRIKDKLDLSTIYELVKSSDLADTAIHEDAQVNVNLNGQVLPDNVKVSLMEGAQEIASAEVVDGKAAFSNLRAGVYKIVAPLSTTDALPESEYLVVREGGNNQATLDYPKKDDIQNNITQTISLRGLGNWEMATVNYNPDTKQVTYKQSPGQPHLYFTDEYAHVTIQKADGTTVLDRTLVGNKSLASELQTFDLEYGDKVIVRHREPAARRVLVRNENKDNVAISRQNAEKETLTYTLTDKGFIVDGETQADANRRYDEEIRKDVTHVAEEIKNHPERDYRRELFNVFTGVEYADPAIKEELLQILNPLVAVYQVDTPTVDKVEAGATSISGKGEPESTITLTFANGKKAEVEVDKDGQWTTQLPEGTSLEHNDVTQVYATGKHGTVSEPISVKALDTVAPKAPVINAIEAGSQTVTGTSEPLSKVTLTLPNGTTKVVDADDKGVWTTTLETPLAHNEVIKAVASDAAENKSVEATQTVKDTVVPEAPVINTIEAGTKVVDGTSEPLSTVTLTLPDGTTKDVKVDDKGVWTTTLETPLAHDAVIKAEASDVAGNKSPEAAQTVKDTVVPEAPVINTIEAGTKEVSGTSEPLSTVALTLPDGTTKDVKADDKGVWTTTLETPLVHDAVIKAVTSDVANNKSPEATQTVKDTIAPAAPTIDKIEAGAKVVSGTSEPLSTVTLTLPDGKTTEVKADADGKWTTELVEPLTHDAVIKAVASDVANNKSAEATQTVKDTVVPAVPVINTIEAGTKEVSGTSEPLSTVTLTLPDGTTKDVKADDKGVWTTTLETPLVHDAVIKAVTSDVANNKSPEATQTVKDTIAPAVPTIDTIEAGAKVVNGTSEPLSTVTLTLPDGKTTEVKTDADGKWTAELAEPLAHDAVIKAVASDVANNKSAEATQTVKDTVVPAVPVINTIEAGDKVVSGTSEPLSKVTLTLPDGKTTEVKTDVDGKWTAELAEPLAHDAVIKAVASDAAGNKSPEATQTVKDTVVPVAPEIKAIEAGAKVVSGTSEPLSTVTLTLPNGKTAEVKTDDKGVWTTTLETPLAHNEVIKAVTSDVANNKSPEATQTVKDTVAPKAPIVNEIKSTDQAIGGSAEPNSNVFVVLTNGKILETKADAEGNWNVELLDGQSLIGNETVKVYAKDLAENQSDTVESEIVLVEVPAEPEVETPAEPAPEVTPEVPVEETTPTEPEIPVEEVPEVPAEPEIETPTEPAPEVTPEVPVEEATPTEPEVPVEEVPEVPTEPEVETPTEPAPEVTPEVPAEEATPTEPEIPVEEVPEVPAEPEPETPTEPAPEVTPEVPVEETTPTEPEIPVEEVPEVPAEPEVVTPTTPVPEVTPEVPAEEATPTAPEVPVEEIPEVPSEPEAETPIEPAPEVIPEAPVEEATPTEPTSGVTPEEPVEEPTSEISEEEPTLTGSETPVEKEPVKETEETSTEISPSKEDTVIESEKEEENDEVTVENNDISKESTGEVTTQNDTENVKTKSVKKDVQDKKSTTLNSKTFTHKKESKTNKQALPETGNETSSMPLLGSLLTLFGLGFIARRFNKNEKTDK
ncbi:Ig-like domain-containing protein [Staphylococcus simulans]|uniref:Ig-like domain-containing protein n=1 Tax=Staphylococcus simulans TaxID=1286 RepID=UPI0029041232|nr:Ig-like domain-containing protein [Staphylococcus simulans]MDU0420493.1 Ig-like domain-containing protein [Staphylococcus simulans]